MYCHEPSTPGVGKQYEKKNKNLRVCSTSGTLRRPRAAYYNELRRRRRFYGNRRWRRRPPTTTPERFCTRRQFFCLNFPGSLVTRTFINVRNSRTRIYRVTTRNINNIIDNIVLYILF